MTSLFKAFVLQDEIKKFELNEKFVNFLFFKFHGNNVFFFFEKKKLNIKIITVFFLIRDEIKVKISDITIAYIIIIERRIYFFLVNCKATRA